ncbi:MAG: hypothetical protein KDB03_14890 [Planctomycetales bacterium]|nr:hypothetical protein [Planctomycetales bacterium]
MFQEPPLSSYDWQFRIFGFRIRVAWGFWVMGAVLGWDWARWMDLLVDNSPGPAILLAVWILGIFVSILVHELGHSFAMRHYGISSHIVLYHFGGLAIPSSFTSWQGARQRRVGPHEQLVISAAGPAFQLILAALLIAVGFAAKIPMSEAGFAYQWFGVERPPLPDSILYTATLDALLFPSIWWALLNLLPIYPLDGGQILHQILLINNIRDALRNTLWVSLGTSIAVALFMAQRGGLGWIMFAWFAMNSWQALQYNSPRW